MFGFTEISLLGIREGVEAGLSTAGGRDQDGDAVGFGDYQR